MKNRYCKGGDNMKITRELTVNKINIICYDPGNKCEVTKRISINCKYNR